MYFKNNDTHRIIKSVSYKARVEHYENVFFLRSYFAFISLYTLGAILGGLLMKKIIAILSLCAIMAFAEENKSKWIVDVGGGLATYSTLIDYALSMRQFDYDDGKISRPDEVGGGTNYAVANLGVRYQLAKMLEVGATTGYEYYSSKVNPVVDKNGIEKYTKTKDNHLIHLAAEAKIDWVTVFDHFQFYSRLGLGTVLNTNKVDDYNIDIEGLSGQISPLGVEYINKLGVYFEAGIGYRGFYSGGISYRF